MTIATDTKTQIKLAQAFSVVLQEWLSSSEMRAVIEANKCESDSHVCHSHDFCDANTAMLEAWESVFGRAPSWLTDSDDDSEIVVWNGAWDIAKAADFFI